MKVLVCSSNHRLIEKFIERMEYKCDYIHLKRKKQPNMYNKENRARLKGSTLIYTSENKPMELLEDIKSDTETIKSYIERVEAILDNQEDLEDYKGDDITKKGLIKEAIKVLRKKFIKIVMK